MKGAAPASVPSSELQDLKKILVQFIDAGRNKEIILQLGAKLHSIIACYVQPAAVQRKTCSAGEPPLPKIHRDLNELLGTVDVFLALQLPAAFAPELKKVDAKILAVKERQEASAAAIQARQALIDSSMINLETSMMEVIVITACSLFPVLCMKL